MSTPKNNGDTKSPDYYGKPDPMNLAHTTVEAVERISSNASASLRAAAGDVRKTAEAIAAYLELLADDYDREGQKAKDAVETHVHRQVSVYEMALSMAKSLRGEEQTGNVTAMGGSGGGGPFSIRSDTLAAELEVAATKEIAKKLAPKIQAE
jgi:hypothetical protein